jgi:hypothetical protein
MTIMAIEYAPLFGGLIPAPCDIEGAACGTIALMQYQLRFHLVLYGGEIWSLFVRQECGM